MDMEETGFSTVAEQKAAGVPADETVTVKEQREGAPAPDLAGEESQDNGDEAGEESQEIPPHSHVLTLANGTVHYYDAADGEPNGPVPTEIDGVPVVHVAHAGEGI